MRIVMIGAGAMGSMLGARFARAGEEVVLYDLDLIEVAAINADGLRVATPDGEISVRIRATAAAEQIGPVDMAVVLVDSNSTKEVAGVTARVLPPTAFVLTLQNGIGNLEALTEV